MTYLPPISAVAPLLSAVATALEKMVPTITRLQPHDSPEAKDAADIHRREIELLNAQAKAAQELAIAERIRTAETVSIDEFYDSKGKAGLGARVQEGGALFGVDGSAQRVTRRTITFTGVKEQMPAGTADRAGWLPFGRKD